MVFFTDLCVHSMAELSLCRSEQERLETSSGEVWGSNSRIGLEDSPGACCHAPRVPMLCLSSILRRWRGEIYQQIQLHAENSEVPAENGWNGLFFPLSHFPFTLLQAPGEYSPSCQCNVAHRGNHAASLASGLPAQRRKCNFST